MEMCLLTQLFGLVWFGLVCSYFFLFFFPSNNKKKKKARIGAKMLY